MAAPKTLEEAAKVMPPMWTIYNRPKDFPDSIIVRMWFGEFPVSEAAQCDSLEIARELVQSVGACVNLGRFDDDEPHIIETWI